MYIDADDPLTAKINQKQKRGQQKKKSRFCTIQHSNALDNYVQNIDEFTIFNEREELNEFKQHFEARNQSFINQIDAIFKQEQTLETFATLYNTLGIVKTDQDGYLFREQLPQAKEVYLYGDFNNWNMKSHPLAKTQAGYWEIQLDKKPVSGSRLKIRVVSQTGKDIIKNPTISQQLAYNSETKLYDSIFIDRDDQFQWKSEQQNKQKTLRIAEVNMKDVDGGYLTFQKEYLPIYAKLGFNAIYFNGLQESDNENEYPINPFALSARHGSLANLKTLVDEIHNMQMSVFFSITTCINSTCESGLYNQDGSDFLYFEPAQQYQQQQVNVKSENVAKFSLAKQETLQLLLSVLNYYLTEFRLDGFVTKNFEKKIYEKSDQVKFNGTLKQIFNDQLQMDGLAYVLISNDLIHTVKPTAITMVQDRSGYPFLTKTLREGGLGYDFLIEMKQISNSAKLIDKIQFYQSLPENEKVIAHLQVFNQQQGIKIEEINNIEQIRVELLNAFLTYTLGSQFGYIVSSNFNSLLAKTLGKEHLKSEFLQLINLFQQQMFQIDNKYKFTNQHFNIMEINKEKQLLIYEKAEFLFIVNCGKEDLKNVKISTKLECDYLILFESGSKQFGGNQSYDQYKNGIKVSKEIYKDRPYHFSINVSAQTAVIIVPRLTQQLQEEEEKVENN